MTPLVLHGAWALVVFWLSYLNYDLRQQMTGFLSLPPAQPTETLTLPPASAVPEIPTNFSVSTNDTTYLLQESLAPLLEKTKLENITITDYIPDSSVQYNSWLGLAFVLGLIFVLGILGWWDYYHPMIFPTQPCEDCLTLTGVVKDLEKKIESLTNERDDPEPSEHEEDKSQALTDQQDAHAKEVKRLNADHEENKSQALKDQQEAHAKELKQLKAEHLTAIQKKNKEIKDHKDHETTFQKQIKNTSDENKELIAKNKKLTNDFNRLEEDHKKTASNLKEKRDEYRKLKNEKTPKTSDETRAEADKLRADNAALKIKIANQKNTINQHTRNSHERRDALDDAVRDKGIASRRLGDTRKELVETRKKKQALRTQLEKGKPSDPSSSIKSDDDSVNIIVDKASSNASQEEKQDTENLDPKNQTNQTNVNDDDEKRDDPDNTTTDQNDKIPSGPKVELPTDSDGQTESSQSNTANENKQEESSQPAAGTITAPSATPRPSTASSPSINSPSSTKSLQGASSTKSTTSSSATELSASITPRAPSTPEPSTPPPAQPALQLTPPATPPPQTTTPPRRASEAPSQFESPSRRQSKIPVRTNPTTTDESPDGTDPKPETPKTALDPKASAFTPAAAAKSEKKGGSGKGKTLMNSKYATKS